MAYNLTGVEEAYLALTILMKADLDEQFDKKRIKGTEYADVYSRLMNTCIDLAFKAPALSDASEQAAKELEIKEKELLKMECEIAHCEAQTALVEAQALIAAKDLELKDKELEMADIKIEDMEKGIEVKETQRLMYERQTEGFDDDLRRKMLDIQMNTWAMMFSSGLLEEKPTIIENDEVSELYNYMKAQVIP